jgi:F-type H+-transporting ATPase subunit gamma
MSETTASLQRKIASAGDLQSVVRSMKAVAASNIGQYEKAVAVLDDYYRSVESGLGVCFRQDAPALSKTGDKPASDHRSVGAVIFGSDQGLVGRFNDIVSAYAVINLAAFPGKARVWAVGARAGARLTDAGLTPAATLDVPTSIKAIAPLIARILAETESRATPVTELHLFYNRPTKGSVYAPVAQQLLPLDDKWRQALTRLPWPTGNLPQIIGDGKQTVRALVRSYLFVSLFRACAESLASENASRLAAMQRADRNIDDMLESLTGEFQQLRQSGIDEELFDVVSGFEALRTSAKPTPLPPSRSRS